MKKKQALLGFQKYQQAFTQHIRNPTQPRQAALKDIPTERLAVYEEIVFTNVYEAISACFPVAQQVLGNAIWRTLIRGFLMEHSATSPIFRQIPAEFLSYLARVTAKPDNTLPAFIMSLCHYEWVELAASTCSNNSARLDLKLTVDFKADATLKCCVAFVGSMFLLHYNYAVHTISAENTPSTDKPTQLLVYCDTAFKVQFLELNAITLQLLQLLQGAPQSRQHRHLAQMNLTQELLTPLSIRDALLTVAQAMPDTASDIVTAFGLDFLARLYQQGVIQGIYAPDTSDAFDVSVNNR